MDFSLPVYQIPTSTTKDACEKYWNRVKLTPNHPEIAPDLGWHIATTLDELKTMIILPRDTLFQIKTNLSSWNLIEKRSQWKWNIQEDPFLNTLGYLWWSRGKGSYVALNDDGTVAMFVPFINPHFENMWSSQLLKKCQKASHKERFEKLLPDVRQWNTVGCLLANEDPVQVRGGGWGLFLNLFGEVSKKYKTKTDFFFHRYDHPVATLYGFEPYYHLVGSFDKLVPGMPSPPRLLNWYRILGNSWGALYVERPIPTADEWELATQAYFPQDCDNAYIDAITEIPWNERISKAIWRGSLTGCGLNEYTNMRLKLALMNEPELMDVGLTSWGGRMKMEFRYQSVPQIGKIGVGYLKKKYGLDKLTKMRRAEQQKYKYIIDLTGNNENPGYRFAWEMLCGFVILWVGEPIQAKSGEGLRRLNLWFWDELKPWIHYVPVRWDLTDLKERIKWCQENDTNAKEIAENAKKLAEKLFKKSSLIQEVIDVLKE